MQLRDVTIIQYSFLYRALGFHLRSYLVFKLLPQEEI